MAYTVKKLQPGQTMGKIQLQGKAIVWNAQNGNNWAVVDKNGNVVFTKNRISGKWQAENYPQKKTAQRQADFLNNHPEKETRTFPIE